MKIANKKVTAERLVKDALEKAKHFKDYNIFTYLNEEGALKKAREIDAKRRGGLDRNALGWNKRRTNR